MQTLDNILAGGEAVPEGKTENEQVAQTGATEGQPAEGETGQTEGQSTEGKGEGDRVPVAALQAERQKVKRYTEEVADFRKQLSETNAAWERRMAELVEAVKPKQEQPQPPDFFENPQAATRHELTQAVTPEFERINQSLLAFAKDNAITRFSEEKVNEAERAFIAAVRDQSLDPADYQRVVSSPNRYAEAVKWHQRRQAQAEIGDDPAAYKARLEAELREKITAELNGGQQQTQQRPAATPSNLAGARNVGSRSGPAWTGPQSIADIFAR